VAQPTLRLSLPDALQHPPPRLDMCSKCAQKIERVRRVEGVFGVDVVWCWWRCGGCVHEKCGFALVSASCIFELVACRQGSCRACRLVWLRYWLAKTSACLPARPLQAERGELSCTVHGEHLRQRYQLRGLQPASVAASTRAAEVPPAVEASQAGQQQQQQQCVGCCCGF